MHVVAAVVVVIALLVLRPAPVWWALAGLAISAVIVAELVNTALERLVNHLHPDVHAEIRVVGDCAAAAVLVVAVAALSVAAPLATSLLG